jgi:hypothetical protein
MFGMGEYPMSKIVLTFSSMFFLTSFCVANAMEKLPEEQCLENSRHRFENPESVKIVANLGTRDFAQPTTKSSEGDWFFLRVQEKNKKGQIVESNLICSREWKCDGSCGDGVPSHPVGEYSSKAEPLHTYTLSTESSFCSRQWERNEQKRCIFKGVIPGYKVCSDKARAAFYGDQVSESGYKRMGKKCDESKDKFLFESIAPAAPIPNK